MLGPRVCWVLPWCLWGPPCPPKLGGEKVLVRGCSCGPGYEQPCVPLGGHRRGVGRGGPWSCSPPCDVELMSS